MKKVLIAGAVLLGGLALAQAVQKSLNITIGGAASSEKAIVVNGKSYVPVSVLKNLGVNAITNGNTLALSRAATTTAPAAPTTTNAGTAGTQQISGGVGVLGTAATLGKQSPLNFTLRSLEYAVGRVAIGNSVWASNAKQKLVLMRFTAQNPQKNADVTLDNASFVFTLVDSNNVSYTPNWSGSELAIARDNDSTPVSTPLKPGQRLDVYTVFVVPFDVSVPKLIVERANEREAGVLRFDLNGKIKAIPAPFSADSNGYKSVQELTAQIGTYYPVGLFDIRLESAQISTTQPGDIRPADGKRFVTFIFGVRNGMPKGSPDAGYGMCGAGGITLEFTDSDGEKQTTQSCGATFFKVTRNENGDGNLRPGEEARVRYYFEVPNGTSGAKLVVSNESSIRYVFDVGIAK